MKTMKKATFGAGCFWGVEEAFRRTEGVTGAAVGYLGGSLEDPTYEDVCTGRTGHAEAIRITYDPAKVTFGQILKVFFSVAHDPTQLDRQGADRGRQYRSAIFYADPEQRRVADAYMRQLHEAEAYAAPIVTTLEPLEAFYEAEAYHHDYAARNPNQGYIAGVSMPKVRKLAKYFREKLKKG